MVSVTAPCIAAWLLMPCKVRNLLRKLRSPHDSMLPSKDQSRTPSSSKVFATSSGTTIRITFSPSINPSVSFSRISLFLIQQVLNFCRSRILVGFSLTSVPSQMMRTCHIGTCPFLSYGEGLFLAHCISHIGSFFLQSILPCIFRSQHFLLSLILINSLTCRPFF